MKRQNQIRQTMMLVGFIVFIDTAGVGLILPVLPQLIMKLTDTTLDRAAELGGWLLFTYAVMQFLFAPVIGGLSDRYGRRPVLLVTLATLGIDYGLMAWAPTLTWLFVGRSISGIMGASFAAANSCIADIVPRDERGKAFGMLGGLSAAGFVLGPVIGGLLGGLGLRLPFVGAAVLALIGAVIGWVILQETLAPERRRHFSLARANPLGSLVQMARTPLVFGCLAVIFMIQLASQSQFSTWSYYGLAAFGWSPLVTGLTIAFFGMLLVVMQGFGSGPIIARFGAARVPLICLPFGIASFLLLAFAPNTQVVLVAILLGSMTGPVFPALQSLMSARVAEDAQGELQGAIASAISLTSILGPPVMTGVFGTFTDRQGPYFPGAPFILAAALAVLAVGLLAWVLHCYAELKPVAHLEIGQ